MKRIFSKHALNVFELELQEWPYGTHTHNFCELILVKKGHGFHTINDSTFPFQTGDIFLLTPEDHHSFNLQSTTQLLYIKFTEQLFMEKAELVHLEDKKRSTRFLFHVNLIQGTIIKDTRDTQNIFALAQILFEEFKTRSPYSRELTLSLFAAITAIVIRQISKYKQQIPSNENDSAKVAQVLSYIRQNIGNDTKITLSSIADEFNISKHYISEYLTKHTGKGLKKIVTETRLARALVLLKQSGLSISQIAQKVGYADVSHMNKAFKKFRGTNPSKERE